ncbi:hypothetical protein NDU88_006123 [Pleurodeles waltl]|uniref:Uncharacterized protein n=1 Tax=Pleurodeles waltl TaxID=8319 RepID=A0AAV7NPF7_PLEWA|nr:hypothetical protein NDU88_006123 [Pleurodeles waltl]
MWERHRYNRAAQKGQGRPHKEEIAMEKPKVSAPPKPIRWTTSAIPKWRYGGVEQREAMECTDEPSRGAIMAAIRDLKGTLEPKMDSVTIDLALLHTDV